MPTKQVPKFVSERLGTEILGAPLGDSERLSALPGVIQHIILYILHLLDAIREFHDFCQESISFARLQGHPFVFNWMGFGFYAIQCQV